MSDTLKVLDLFSGIGGFSLGLERAGMETVAFCEFDEHAQRVLKKHWPDIPIHEDVRTLDGTKYRGSVDVVCGGFPCQDLSHAGKKAGIEGGRSSLYREMLRIISECLPRYAIFENVSALITGESGRWFAQFLYDLASIGYDAEWHCISASELGAYHHRDRVWIIAYPNNDGQVTAEVRQSIQERNGGNQEGAKPAIKSKGLSSERVSSNSNMLGCERFAKIAHDIKQQVQFMRSDKDDRGRFDLSEPALCGANDGVPYWVDGTGRRKMQRTERLKRLGNSVVPQIPEIIGRAILELES